MKTQRPPELKNIYWDKSHKRWRVSFQRNGKTLRFSHSKTLEDAMTLRDAVVRAFALTEDKP